MVGAGIATAADCTDDRIGVPHRCCERSALRTFSAPLHIGPRSQSGITCHTSGMQNALHASCIMRQHRPASAPKQRRGILWSLGDIGCDKLDAAVNLQPLGLCFLDILHVRPSPIRMQQKRLPGGPLGCQVKKCMQGQWGELQVDAKLLISHVGEPTRTAARTVKPLFLSSRTTLIPVPPDAPATNT